LGFVITIIAGVVGVVQKGGEDTNKRVKGVIGQRGQTYWPEQSNRPSVVVKTRFPGRKPWEKRRGGKEGGHFGGNVYGISGYVLRKQRRKRTLENESRRRTKT